MLLNCVRKMERALLVVVVVMLAGCLVGAERNLLLVTVATNETDGYKRFERSCKVCGWKVNLLKQEMEKIKDDENSMVMFTDSYDVVVAAGKEELLKQFDKFEAKIVFGSEGFCWPDSSLADKYPEVEEGKRYLNSGGFIGKAGDIYDMLIAGGEIKNTEDDQLFYTKIFLNKELRNKFQMKLDNKAELFQNLNGAGEDVEIRFTGSEPFLQNTAYNTMPLVIHGNGPSKLLLNNLAHYLAQAWSIEGGCSDCWEGVIDFKDLVETPKIVMAIFFEKATPFTLEFFEKIADLNYDKSSIDLFIHNAVEFHQEEINAFVKNWNKDNSVDGYNSIEVIDHTVEIKEWHARNKAVEKCVDIKCDYLFVIDSEAQLDNPHSLKLLIEQNRRVVAPMLIRPYSAWSNFWGMLASDGFYARSQDYMEIVNNDRRGLWNVPFISSCYLIAGSVIHNKITRPTYIRNLLDPDMAFAENLRMNDIFVYVSNRINFGHLVNNEEFPTIHKYNDLWEIKRNRWDWEQRYLNVNYSQSLAKDATIEEPCPDVFWFPIFSERFCDELVDEAESYGSWSDGTNSDKRLEGGYEAVPTRDIHMNQIGFDDEWLYVLDFYVRPLQEVVFVGYFHQPPRSTMNFMVRYRPDEQPNLRPHHDSSTYTINVALNTPRIDYEGGGCGFVRQNCEVIDTRKGWTMMHPGRLTHFHEGLFTTKGTRYIMISFVDP